MSWIFNQLTVRGILILTEAWVALSVIIMRALVLAATKRRLSNRNSKSMRLLYVWNKSCGRAGRGSLKVPHGRGFDSRSRHKVVDKILAASSVGEPRNKCEVWAKKYLKKCGYIFFYYRVWFLPIAKEKRNIREKQELNPRPHASQPTSQTTW